MCEQFLTLESFDVDVDVLAVDVVKIDEVDYIFFVENDLSVL